MKNRYTIIFILVFFVSMLWFFFKLALLIFSIVALLTIVLYPWYVQKLTSKYKPYLNWDEAYHFKVKDNWNLPFYYYGDPAAIYPKSFTKRKKEEKRLSKSSLLLKNPRVQSSQKIEKYPIILCHGIMANHLSFDLTPDLSLALYLKRHGFHVYSIDLRGCGLSYLEDNGNKKNIQSKLKTVQFWKKLYSSSNEAKFSFDNMVEDIPDIINAVLTHHKKKTGFKTEKIHWLGHSLGSMLPYAAFNKDPLLKKKIKSYILLGSPIGVSGISHKLVESFLKYPRKYVSSINLKFFAKLFSPFAGKIKTQVDDFLYNDKLVSHDNIRRYLIYAIENINPLLTDHLIKWMRSGKMTNIKGDLNYASSLNNINIPVLALTGSLDNLGTTKNIEKGMKEIGSKDKKLVILSKENGFVENYCHGGLLFSEQATKEVFPIISEWLHDKS